MNQEETLRIAKIAFDAYNAAAGGKTWDGKDIPPFEAVGERVQANWCAAIKAVLAEPKILPTVKVSYCGKCGNTHADWYECKTESCSVCGLQKCPYWIQAGEHMSCAGFGKCHGGHPGEKM